MVVNNNNKNYTTKRWMLNRIASKNNFGTKHLTKNMKNVFNKPGLFYQLTIEPAIIGKSLLPTKMGNNKMQHL